MIKQVYEGVTILQWGREKRNEMEILNLGGKLVTGGFRQLPFTPILNRPQVGKDS